MLPVPVAAVLVTAFARARGITWAELGLARSTWGRGAAYALAVVGLVLVVVAVVAAMPWTRSAFTDDRYDYGIGHALLVALVFIPLRTVIAEELVFRGVLLAALARLHGTRTAVIASSILFGLWHVLSSLHLAQDNQAVASPLGSGSLGQVARRRWLGAGDDRRRLAVLLAAAAQRQPARLDRRALGGQRGRRAGLRRGLDAHQLRCAAVWVAAAPRYRDPTRRHAEHDEARSSGERA